MKLGIFDSGIGGEAIALSLQTAFPNATIITVNDHDNVPYGDKAPNEIVKLTDNAIQPLLKDSCNIIILACNTATMLALPVLRQRYPQQKFIGIEPMVKTAALLTKTNAVAVCATPATLSSNRYHELLKSYAKSLTVLEPDCSTWAYMIENNRINRLSIEATIEEVCSRNVDIIVLGCTHYLWIKDFVQSIAGKRAIVIEPSEAIARRVKELLQLS